LENLPESWKDDLTCAYLDANHFTHDLVVRSWKPEDSFCPLGMKGQRKKIQDFFSDLKLEQIKRHAVPIVEAPEGIVWVAGFRMDHRFRVMNGTKRFVALRLGSQDLPSSFE
jgi:tRNA(Ile)-lysidine synthase